MFLIKAVGDGLQNCYMMSVFSLFEAYRYFYVTITDYIAQGFLEKLIVAQVVKKFSAFIITEDVHSGVCFQPYELSPYHQSTVLLGPVCRIAWSVLTFHNIEVKVKKVKLSLCSP
jgi:hypothetical protein